jgi:predicted nucleotidyltransferase
MRIKLLPKASPLFSILFRGRPAIFRGVRAIDEIPSLVELRNRVRPFCDGRSFRRLKIFGSVVRGNARSGSDVVLLVTLGDSRPVSTAELLEMAGEAEEVVGAPVDFVLRQSLEKSPNHFAREHPLNGSLRL